MGVILPDLKSETVARALRDDVLKHGWGRPDQWVCGGASYFISRSKGRDHSLGCTTEGISSAPLREAWYH